MIVIVVLYMYNSEAHKKIIDEEKLKYIGGVGFEYVQPLYSKEMYIQTKEKILKIKYALINLYPQLINLSNVYDSYTSERKINVPYMHKINKNNYNVYSEEWTEEVNILNGLCIYIDKILEIIGIIFIYFMLV